MNVTANFYVTGGTLRHDAPSYVERDADTQLYENLQRGEFCYLLTARQRGKSSLTVRTAVRLRAKGIAVVVLDLTMVGQNLTVDQWYDGLLNLLGQQLDMEDILCEFWQANSRLGPLRRWMAALEQVVLPTICQPPGGTPRPLVIFIDEIDIVRSLPFSSDEFFAAIRSCYNRRTEDPAFESLTFCLLGVATPGDLIRDTRMTPFNIGRRIELDDFTERDAAPLQRGLSTHPQIADRLLQRVLYWTGGHPYLTQRLCRAVAEQPHSSSPRDVDRLCAELFLSAGARDRDDNLVFVRERLLNSEVDRTSLLGLYARLRQGKCVPNDETNPLVSVLRLAGIAHSAGGQLEVRNRIYKTVFDQNWILANLPAADVRRQRRAYKRGVIGAVATIAVLSVLLSLPLFKPATNLIQMTALKGNVEFVSPPPTAAGPTQPIPDAAPFATAPPTTKPAEPAARDPHSEPVVSGAPGLETNHAGIDPKTTPSLDLAAGQTLPPAPVPTLVQVLGSVHRSQPGGDWTTVTNGQWLMAGDCLRTGPESHAAVVLADGSKVHIGASSMLAIPADPQRRTGWDLIKGVLHFFHRSKKDDQEIRTPQVKGTIRG